MARIVRILIPSLVAVLFAIQLVPVERENPPVTAPIDAPAEVVAVLRESCFDCHSNETRWPWYARVAPVSWLVADDVEEGREHLNFSTWASKPASWQAEHRGEIWEEIEEGEMPLWYYLPLHPSARLDTADRDVLRAWTGGGEGRESREGRWAEEDEDGDEHEGHEHD